MKSSINGKFEQYKVETGKLKNGLRIIHMPFPSEISYCGIVVNTGARDEYNDEHGMAHFVEHLLFKGTRKRRAHHISSRMENVGGELNAYTTKEETFIYSTFLSEHFDRATELLSDIVFNSVFPGNQIQKEREVILDEINSYIDSPSELIYDDFENLIFRNNDIGHYILGEPQTLKKFDEQKIKDFVARQYQPSNMVFFSLGKTPFSKVMKLCEKYFKFESDDSHALKTRMQPVVAASGTVKMRKDTAQAHVMTGIRSYDMFHPQRNTLYLLNHILGGGVINSRLNNALREKNGLVYHVESNLASYTDTGFFAIYFACDHKYVKRCLKLLKKEIELLKNKPLTSLQLITAKRQYKGQLGIAFENNETVALRMAKSFLHFDRYFSLQDLFERIDAVAAADLQEAANQLFIYDHFLELQYGV